MKNITRKNDSNIEDTLENEKIIDLIFAEKGESIEAEAEAEAEVETEGWQQDEKLRFDIHEMVSLKQPWYIRLINVFAFVILAFSSMLLLLGVIVVSMMSFVRYSIGVKDWNLSLLWWWKLYCRCLVLALTALIGIFNVQFALTILAVYFSLFDSSTLIMGKLSRR